ncbi:MAG: GNAT family N-acetyltransferase [Acidimicrobiia bacterium]|nr:GNAT family N-acetyltransferase [Acidimicrobiia bacterium]
MDVAARPATLDDLDELLSMYRLLETEMTALKPLWDLAEGLAEPARASLEDLVDAEETTVAIGTIDGVPLGFLVGRVEPLLPQADRALRAAVTYVFTVAEARQVGVAEAMMDHFFEWADDLGIDHFDAHVSPGHRLAKNFFEANGFTARHIVMYSSADR